MEMVKPDQVRVGQHLDLVSPGILDEREVDALELVRLTHHRGTRPGHGSQRGVDVQHREGDVINRRERAAWTRGPLTEPDQRLAKDGGLEPRRDGDLVCTEMGPVPRRRRPGVGHVRMHMVERTPCAPAGRETSASVPTTRTDRRRGTFTTGG